MFVWFSVMIKVSQLSKSFNGQCVLDDISLQINASEMIVILGESGTGKSVLLKHLMGLLKPDAGTVWIDGEDITRLSEKKLLKVRQKIGYLFQEGALYDFMNVFENIAFPLREHTSLSREEIKKKIQNAFSVTVLHYNLRVLLENLDRTITTPTAQWLGFVKYQRASEGELKGSWFITTNNAFGTVTENIQGRPARRVSKRNLKPYSYDKE